MRRFVLPLLLLASPALSQSAAERAESERVWAAQRAARGEEWRIVYYAGRKIACVPVGNSVPGARTPHDVLAAIRTRDPHAYIDDVPEGTWERIIRTEGHNLRMVKNERYCREWFNFVR